MKKALAISLALGGMLFLPRRCPGELLKGWTDAPWGGDGWNPCAWDVPGQILSLRTHGDVMGFHMSEDYHLMGGRGHIVIGREFKDSRGETRAT